MNEEALFQASARALVKEATSLSSAHPSPNELLAYQRREISSSLREAVQEHLALCHSCTQLILDLERSAKPGLHGHPPLAPERVATAWEELYNKIEAAASPPPQAKRSLPLRFAVGLAALWVASIIGLGFWVFELRRTVDELREPRIDVAVSDLIPASASPTRSERSPTVVTWPASSGRLLLLLNLADFREMPDYLLEIEDEAGRIVWSRRGLQRTPDGHFTLELSRGDLLPGTYYLSLFGLAPRNPEAEPTLLVEYSVDLKYE